MKSLYRYIGILSIYCIITSLSLTACPTCVGRLEAEAPPFFTPDYDDHWQHKEVIPAPSTATPASEKITRVEHQQ
jgi:hypothetical protein